MKIPRWALAALSGAALALAPTAAQAAAPNATDQAGASASRQAGGLRADAGQPQPAQGLCRPGNPPNAPPTTAHFDDNPLLGPAVLPGAPPVGPLLAGYQRFGGRTGTEFLRQFGNATGTGYVYPPASGFVLGPDGPIKNQQTLLPGYRLDRFGFPGGAFLAPLGTPFGARSLPPSNLNTPAGAPLANYHVYCVVRPFAVDSGPIAPWFAQSGLGTQFQLNPGYLPQAGATLSITWLLQHGYLVEEDLTAGACALPLQRGYAPAVC
ncbi:TNT domain-containing protein [Micromonospora sp. NBC_01655]|uniref:TNT domain-containing protein n=1 Tax=Micromonospora sp. NBC_01655 TaxID=2975983 RepID=UPI0022550104|nr:TNT domain-containing protein [Micromonospora sp. NBC_01655]MCX4469013.1 TNT domain-containing protein [Micromonospora sp. NBC_01655]